MAGHPGPGVPPEVQDTSLDAETVLKVEPLRRASGSVPEDPMIGLVLAERYRVEQRLGVGGMGAVYRAVHVHMKNTVALKVLHPQMLHIPEAVARFEREAIAAARIQHPNVARALDFGRLHDGTFYMALEFVKGVSLRDVLKHGPLPTVRVVNIVRQIAEALHAAHEQGVIHRDLKPENVMLLSGGKDVVKVLDFGIAKVALSDATRSDNQITRAGAVFGTPDYMSPEQASGREVDARTDLYALGIVAYELLSGSPPFTGDSIAQVLLKHLNEEPPPFPPQVDWRVADLVLRLLAKDPAARPLSARAVAEELHRLRLSLVPQRPAAHLPGQLVAKLRSAWQSITLHRYFAWARGVLARRVKIGPRLISVGALLSSFVVSLLLVGSLASSRSKPEASELAEAQTVQHQEGSSEAEAPKAAPARNPELEALLAMPVYKRKLPEWRRLGQLHSEAQQWPEAVSAYRNAVQLDKGLAKDPVLLQTFRDLLVKRDCYESVTNVAVNLLGEPGLDLLYDAWQQVKNDKKQRTLTEYLYKQLEIHHSRRASKALKVTLDLEFSSGLECPQLQKIVESGIKYADTRSVSRLEALQDIRGCGFDKQRDCYPCLRENADLQAALQTARETPAPRFDGKRYVPAR